MSRRFQACTVTTTDGREVEEGESITGTEIDDLVIANGLVQVLMEPAVITEQRGCAHLKRWNGSAFDYAIDPSYGDYTYFVNTPTARPDRVRIIEKSKDLVHAAVEWDTYDIAEPSPLPNGVIYRDWTNAINYAQGQSNPNWKYIASTHLVKTIIVKRGREGYFTGYHSDPRVGPVASRIPTDNHETAFGEREIGPGVNFRVVFSSAGEEFTRYNPDEGTTTGLGIDDPVSLGGATQTTGPWWAAGIPDPSGTSAGFCTYAALRQRLAIKDYQLGPSLNGQIIVNYLNEAHDENNVPYETMMFIGAFPYEPDADLSNEPTTELRTRVAARCPLDFEETGTPDDDSEATFATEDDARDCLAGLVSAAEPTSMGSFGFTSFREATATSGGLEAWAKTSLSDSLRYFAVRLLSSEESEESGGTLVTATCECVIAYPTDGNYGDETAESLAVEDMTTIETALDGSDDIACTVTDTATEVQGRVTFATVSFTAEFWSA